jgi:nucleoside transporter
MNNLATTAVPLSLQLNTRLSAMMFLQYAIWGAWVPLLGPFLRNARNFEPTQIGNIFAVGAIGMIVAPAIAGQIADRWFSTERFLAICHICGGILIWQLASTVDYGKFLILSLIYSLLYSPTLALTNSLAFHHLPDRDRDFGRIRLWGTIGWIIVGIGIGQWLLHRHTPADATAAQVALAQSKGMADAFRLSGILGIVMGVFCLTLPHTPPARGRQRNATLEALGVIRKNPLLTLFLLAVPVSCIYQFYMVYTADFLGNFQSKTANDINKVFGVGGGGLMTIGQMSEIFVLALMPFFAKRISRKSLLAVGILAAGIRMALFAYVDQIQQVSGIPVIALLITAVAMHGLWFGCFTFVAFLVVDEETSDDVRASAQGLFFLVSGGIGTIVGSKVATWVAEWAMPQAGAMDYTKLFSVPMWLSVACLAALCLFYSGGKRKSDIIATSEIETAAAR